MLWRAGNWRRRRREAPDYVLFLLEGAYPELPPARTRWWQQFLPGDDSNLRHLSRHFKTIASDPRVHGVVLHLRPLFLPLSSLQTLREQLLALRAAGKRVVVWSHGYDMGSYYLASAADQILLLPGGTVAPTGLARELVFLKETLEEAGVAVDAVQIAPYKSAPNTFTQSSSTPEMREMMTWLLDDTFEDLLEGIAAGRGLSMDEARALVDRAPYTDVEALAAGVVDGVLSEEALPEFLGTGAKPARLAMWEQAEKSLLRRPPAPPGRYVAVLRIEGAIMPGQSRRPPFRIPLPIPFFMEEQAGDLSVVQAARALLDDEQAAAVVLFIDSPGGSAAASEAMAAALERLAARKPLVAVMGAVAASGGYYVATPAQWIVAQPGTITGSIGVFSLKPVVGGLLDKLKLGRETLSRGQHATLYDLERPFTEEERALIWRGIERTYDLFLARVAASRRMTREEADAVGGGRVWTGRQALARGLVDELGGLEEGIARARSLANLPPDSPVRQAAAPRHALPPAARPPQA